LSETGYAPVSPLSAGLRCRCPRCGKGKLYDGFLTVAERCTFCGLDLRAQDSGDGPAVFVILLLGFVVVGLALWVEVTYMPPYWVHAVLWLPTIVVGALAMLRPLKALMVALHYKHDILDRRPGDPET
jgi:uncharacterized protein (DUF983 family)